MKYFPIVWSGLWRRPVRTVLTVLSVITAFFLFGVLQGINAGVNSAFDLLNVSRLRVMSRVSMNEPLPLAHLARIRAVPGVVSATPLNLVIGTYQQPTQVIPVVGVEVEELLKIYPRRCSCRRIRRPPCFAPATARSSAGGSRNASAGRSAIACR